MTHEPRAKSDNTARADMLGALFLKHASSVRYTIKVSHVGVRSQQDRITVQDSVNTIEEQRSLWR